MVDPFLKATRRTIRRVGRHQSVLAITEMGEERKLGAVFVNPESVGYVRQSGKGSGGPSFRSTAKRLRALTEEVHDITNEWVIVVNGGRYFPADWEADGEGSTLIFLATSQELEEGDPDGWR